MANLQLHQALTTQVQNQIKKTDLDQMVRWLAQYSVITEEDPLSFFFSWEMPGLFPNGEYGWTVFGDSGMHVIPEPNKLDHRTSHRYGELPRYDVKIKSLWGVTAPMTIYSRDLRLNLYKPEEWKAIHLTAVARALPNYFRYLSFMIFAGTSAKTKERPLLREYIGKYIEPSDGANNGYPFYLSDGYGEINLSKVITKAKVKEHALKKRLDEINKLLYNDEAKIEVQKTKYFKANEKAWIRNNLTAETQNSLSVYYEARKQIQKIKQAGYFENKYKGDKSKFEGYNPPVSVGDLVLILNSDEWLDAQLDFNFTDDGKAQLNESLFLGAKVLFSNDIDKNTALLMDRRLIKAAILPGEQRYITVPYEHEETIDHFYESRHSLDVIPIYSRLWIKFKAG